MITYRLDRTLFYPHGIIGYLYRMDEMLCFTLEPAKNRAFEPAIPEGSYSLAWTMSPKLGVMTPRLEGVPNRQGILIHAGNTDKDSEGCILVGMSWQTVGGVPQLSTSRVARDKVYKLVEADLSEGGFAEIVIKETV